MLLRPGSGNIVMINERLIRVIHQKKNLTNIRPQVAILSQVTNLDNQTDSVNFNEIVRVSPPPSGYHHLIVRSCGTTSQIESFIIIISSYHHHVILPSSSYYHHPHHHVQTCSTYCVPKWPMEVQPSSTSPTMKSKQVEHILPSSPLPSV